jgi:hypothetical protein
MISDCGLRIADLEKHEEEEAKQHGGESEHVEQHTTN